MQRITSNQKIFTEQTFSKTKQNLSKEVFLNYLTSFTLSIKSLDINSILHLTDSLYHAFLQKKQVFICGNGGSAANAIHWANDFSYPVTKRVGEGLRIHALTANTAVLTCLGNDVGYGYIFSSQIKQLANSGDILVALSGSGNSSNIVNAIETANKLSLATFVIVGFDGGTCSKKAQHVIHCKVNDMQYAEDLQMVINHMIMRYLHKLLKGN